MKTSSRTIPAATALLTAAVFAATTLAQSPQAPPPAAGGPPPQARTMPAPTNLKVLPKDWTGQQVRQTMSTWAGSLGVECEFCHAADTTNPGPNGRARLNFPDDSKPDKAMARIMYTMTEDINKNYVSKVMEMDKMDTPAGPVTCGTCHRGHQMPEAFVIQRGNGPRPPQTAAPAPPPPGITQPQQ